MQGDRERLARWAQAGLARLIEDSCRQVSEELPEYYADGPAQVVPTSDLARSISHNLRAMVTAIGRPDEPLELAAPRETGRRRAQQGVPLPEVLRAYRISFRVLWDTLAAQVHQARQPALTEALVATAGIIWRRTDEHAVALTESYRTATAEMLLAEQRRRGAVVEALLSGRPGPEAGPWEAAALLGFPSDASLVVVVAEARTLGEEGLPSVEQGLAERGIMSGWRLTPVQQIGVVSFDPARADEVVEVLRELATTRTGVSPAYQSLGETPRALRLAQAAMAGLPPDVAAVRTFDQSPLAALTVSEPAEARRLAQQILGEVLQQPREERDLLIETLATYIDQGGSAERAGKVLYCHPNTIRNRLRKVQELTGRSLADPRDIAELTTAAYAVRLAQATALVSGPDGRRRS